METNNEKDIGIPITHRSTRTMRIGEALTHYGREHKSDITPEIYCNGCNKLIKNKGGLCYRCSKVKEQVASAQLVEELARLGIIHKQTAIELVSGSVHIVDKSVAQEAREWEELFNARDIQQRSDEARERGLNKSKIQQTPDKFCSTCGIQIPTAMDVCEGYDKEHSLVEVQKFANTLYKK